jgi:ABC-2 type transport system ATP-binding protein
VTPCEGANVEAALSALAPLASDRPTAEDGIVRVPISDRSGVIAAAVRSLDQAGVAIDDIAIRMPTLDDVFLTLTGRPPEPEDSDEDGTPTDAEHREMETAQ